MPMIVTVWAYVCLAIVIALAVAARRIGRDRAAAWLVALGLFLLAIEEPALTFWLGLADPQGDRDGMATLITPQARAHVLDAGVFGAALAALLGWIAMNDSLNRRDFLKTATATTINAGLVNARENPQKEAENNQINQS